jgi:hypothetical protein
VKLTKNHLFAAMALFLLIFGVGCSDRDPSGLETARATIDPVVFEDDLNGDVYFQAFFETYYEAVSLDSVYATNGIASLKVTVPPAGSPLGGYSGGVLTSASVRDNADFNALTFYARSNITTVLNVSGFGNDNTGNSRYDAARFNVPLTPEWEHFIIPIPAPGKLIAERGLFTFADGSEDQIGHQIYFDDIRFENLSDLPAPQPRIPSVTKQYFVGSTVSLEGTYTNYVMGGSRIRVDHMPGYFDFASTDPSVASVIDGQVKITGVGNAVITATLDTTAAAGAMTLTGFPSPDTAADSPSVPQENVISLFSDVYSNAPVDSWNPNWSGTTTELADYKVGNSNTKMYSSLNWVGIVFTSQTIDISEMTHMHLDVFAPAGTNFKIELAALDGDGGDILHQPGLVFTSTTTPGFVAEEWSYLEIPLADFQFTAPLDHVGQIVLSTSDAKLVLVDNIYWHN